MGHKAEDCETPHYSCRRVACIVPPSHKFFGYLEQCPNSKYWNGRREQAPASSTELPVVPKVEETTPQPLALPTPPPAIATPPFRASESPLTPLEITPEPVEVITMPGPPAPSFEVPVTPTPAPPPVRQSRIPRGAPKSKGKKRVSPRRGPYSRPIKSTMTEQEAEEITRGASGIEEILYDRND